jgi:integrase
MWILARDRSACFDLLSTKIKAPPKTLASRRPIPMSDELEQSLKIWRGQASFPSPEDCIFASPHALGRQPYWPDVALKRHILPLADKAGVAKKIGWHCFRRTLATLLLSSGASIKTAQELLRHASPQMTLGTYAKAVTADKRGAQASTAAMLSGAA